MRFMLLMMVCGAAAASADSSYQFTILAKVGDTFDGQSLASPQGAGINASGTIVYTAEYVCRPMAGFCQDVFQTALSNLGSSPTLVTNDGGGPRIDDHGTILFGCSGAVCTQSGVIAKRGDTTGGNGPISYIWDWVISPGGDIVVRVEWDRTNSDGSSVSQEGLLTPSALFVVGCESRPSGGYPCTGASGDIIDGQKMLSVLLPIGFNPNGDWAFNCTPDPGAPFQGNLPFSICTREHILVQPGSVIGGNTLTSAYLIGASNSGTLIFRGDGQSNGSRAIYSLNPNGVVVQPGDTVAGHYIDAIYGDVALSSGGTLAYNAHFNDGAGSQGEGLFIKSTTGSSLVLKQGDTINGMTVSSITPNAVRDDGTVVLTIFSDTDSMAAVVGQPVMSLSPASLTFAPQAVGTTSSAQFVTVTNNGSSPLTFTGDTVSGDFALAGVGTCGTTLAPGASCTISIHFAPTAAGTRTGVLTIPDNAPNSPQTVSLTGTGGQSGPTVSFSPTSLTFAAQPVGTTSSAQFVTVTNTGSATLTFTGDTVSGDFALAGVGTCGTSLAPGANCTISIHFTPTATGTRTGVLTIPDNAPNSPQTVSLTGTGGQSGPALSLSPASLTFAAQAVGTTSSAQFVTVTNTGSATLTFTGDMVSGDFALAGVGTCGTSLAPGANCTISIHFTPTATGTRTGTLTIPDNAPNSPQTVPLSGTGQ